MQGCSVNKRCGNAAKKLAILKQLQTHFEAVFNEVMQKVWERRSHAFPQHCNPGVMSYCKQKLEHKFLVLLPVAQPQVGN